MQSPNGYLWQITLDRAISDLRTHYKPGERFHSVKEMVSRYGVSEITARRAIRELGEMGLISKAPRRGCIVNRQDTETEILLCIHKPALFNDIGFNIISEFFQGMGAEVERRKCKLSTFIPKQDGPLPSGRLALGYYFGDGEPEFKFFNSLKEAGNRIVCIHTTRRIDGISTVRTNYADAMDKIVEHLHSRGHRRIAFMTEEVSNEWTAPRLDGYYAALRRRDLFFDSRHLSIIESLAEVPSATDRLLSLEEPPSAVIAWNPETAYDIYLHCQRRGVPVPEKLAIVSFGNKFNPLVPSPSPLTSLDYDIKGQGKAAVNLLLSMAETPNPQVKDILSQNKIVPRQSS